jgi:phosphoenolpyruvate synthase/pyruvate phosphate dikinase
MSKEDYYLFKVAQEFSYQKGIRRDLSFKAYWQVTKLLEEISRRLLLTVEQVRNITVEEMQNYLIENKIDKKKLNERIKLCATLVRQEKFSYFSGKEANDLVKEIDSDLIIDKDVQELKGSVAYPGKVIGKVKIIQRKEDMSKMEKGDILVSFATNPELVPAMKKAGAIVTDEGGITCHAAIVSREMKIPCVIGTKNASKIFKDGDLVEVDAERGLVKIIKE